MSFEQFLESLSIPRACEVSQKIYKKHFIDNLNLSKSQSKLLSSKVSEIKWLYTIKPDNSNIQSYQDEDREYLEIAFIHVTLASTKQSDAIIEIIQKIPYPLVLLLTFESLLQISLAHKRINKSDTTKLTIQEYLSTPWIDLQNPKEVEKGFVASLSFDNLDIKNLYRLYQDYASKLIALKSSMISGTYTDKIDAEKHKELLSKIEVLEIEIKSIKSQIKNETQFNEKVALNMRLKELEKTAEGLTKIL